MIPFSDVNDICTPHIKSVGEFHNLIIFVRKPEHLKTSEPKFQLKEMVRLE